MTSFALKWIAILTMLADHIGVALVPDGTAAYYICRAVGRMAFPLFAFMLAEGYFYTKDVKKYLFRLAVFAVASELPFNWLVTGNSPLDGIPGSLLAGQMNVFVTLTLALAGIWLFDGFAARDMRWAALAAMLAAAMSATLIHSDYEAFGVLMVFIFYRYRGERGQMAAWFTGAVTLYTGALLLAAWPSVYHMRSALLNGFELTAIVPILLYNRKKGYSSKGWQYFFYTFYPAHIIVLCLLRHT